MAEDPVPEEKCKDMCVVRNTASGIFMTLVKVMQETQVTVIARMREPTNYLRTAAASGQ